MNPPASKKATMPKATVSVATRVRCLLRLRLRVARRKSESRLIIGRYSCARKMPRLLSYVKLKLSEITMQAFDYDKAFSRNIGWVTEQKQALLRNKRIAIAGMGGVGGSHLLTLGRLGGRK